MRYKALVETLVSECKDAEAFDPWRVFASLRLHGWSTLLRDPASHVDPHERMLFRIIVQKQPGLQRQFISILHATPNAPLRALCMLFTAHPEVEQWLGMPADTLRSAVAGHSHLVPPDWRGHYVDHLVALVRSVELWLQAILLVKIK